jgi:hypothetical protein
MSESLVSEEEKAAKGSEIRKKVTERIRAWVKDKSQGIEQSDRHSFDAVKKKAVEGQSQKNVATRIKSALESGGGALKDEASKTKKKMLMKTLGIVASVAAFIDPEPVSKVALGAAATGIGVAEKASEIKAMKEAHDGKKAGGNEQLQSALAEKILSVGNPTA